MTENSHTEDQVEALKKAYKSHPIATIFASFTLGILITVILANRIKISSLPSPIQQAIIELNHLPSDISGKYYYVVTPQNISELPINCAGKTGAKEIWGTVEIHHQRTIFESKIFFNGERLYCVNDQGLSNLHPSQNWDSRWAILNEDNLYARLEMGDDKESFLEAKLSNDSDIEQFSATMAYISKTDKTTGTTNIKFYKCKEACDKKLGEAISEFTAKK